jgi:glycosyltransferase involved in cell wall biosynthesis
MHISIIGSAGIPARYGGFETLAENLVKNHSEEIEYTVFCSRKEYSKTTPLYSGVKLKYLNLYANGISSILYDLVAMLLSLSSDIMLVLGVSASLFFPFIKLLYKGKIITNIDGIEWKRNKWNKFARYFLYFSEKLAVKYSDIVICDNQGILDYVKEKHGREACLIEYGADHVWGGRGCIGYCSQYAITVCRFEPENNIDIILNAFSRQDKVSLKLVGNWRNSKYGIKLFDSYKKYNHIILLDPIYDRKKVDMIRSSAFLYIHGHSAGGTNPSLVEAMYLGLPVYAFDCIYNRYTTEDKCMYWSTSDELFELICNLDNIVLENIGMNMKAIAEKRYTWDLIVKKYEDMFRGVIKW